MPAIALLFTNEVLGYQYKITKLLEIAAAGMLLNTWVYNPPVLEMTASSFLFISSILSSSPFRKRI
jgi:hypothetical protein